MGTCGSMLLGRGLLCGRPLTWRMLHLLHHRVLTTGLGVKAWWGTGSQSLPAHPDPPPPLGDCSLWQTKPSLWGSWASLILLP